MEVRPFKIQVPEETLEDLRQRLARTRWPGEIEDSGWDYGSNLAYMKELVEYWRTGFDWRAQERALNTFSHYRADIDGLGVHFIHERGKGPNPLPIIITHGWPSSFFEMTKLIPLLADPASHGGDPGDSFDVVVPSMPGYGFSDRPTKEGMSALRIGELWGRLVTEGLGYDRFAAQGGDWGSTVTSRLAHAYSQQVVGILVTSMDMGTLVPYMGPGSRELSDAEKALHEDWAALQRVEGGYGHIQGTKPQTIGYSLNDSPVGLAAWIVEKFRAWTDCDGDVERRYSKDELLTNVTIYWATETPNSAGRLYYETHHTPWRFAKGERIKVPCAIALFPKEPATPPREWAERIYNVQRWTHMARGGHFGAFEEPGLLADEIRTFFRQFRR